MRLIIEHLSKRYEKKQVLKQIDFTFEEGKIYGLLGRNGAGKTTFFNCLNRDIAADEGQFFLEDAAGRKVLSSDWVCAEHPRCAGVFDRAGICQILSRY